MKIQENFESTDVYLTRLQILIFSDFSSSGVGLLYGSKKCHHLQVAKSCMILFQSKESTRDIFLFIKVCERIKKNLFFSSNF